MYLPTAFELNDLPTLQSFIMHYPFATLVTWNQKNGQMQANHIPMLLKKDEGPYGTLEAHIGKNNPLWEEYDQDTPALVIFHGPHSYISPEWYPTKKTTGKAVPTWDYVVVHAHGLMQTVTDFSWLQKHLSELTLEHEKSLPTPWRPEDAPAEFIEKLTHAVVGIRIAITKLEGKCKISQNQPIANQQGIVKGLRQDFAHDSQAQALANLIDQDGLLDE